MPQPIAPLPDNLSPDVAALLQAAVNCGALLTDGLHTVERAYALAFAPEHDHHTKDLAAAAYVKCYFLHRTGAVDRTVEFGVAALPLIESELSTEAYGDALRWTGLCACDAGRFDIAINLASEGFRLAESVGDPRRRVLAFSMLGGCFERSGDPWQGERLLREGLALARTLDDPYPLMVSINNLSAVLNGKFYSLREGSALEAQDALVESIPLAREVLPLTAALNDPYVDAFTLGNLGELLVHSGDFAEAELLLNQAHAMAVANGYGVVASRVQCSIAELHLARGDTQSVKKILNELVAPPGTPPPLSTRLRLYYCLYLAHRADAESAAALSALEAFRRLENQRSMQQLKSKSEVMVTRLEADESQRKGIAYAQGLATAEASRAIALERLTMQDELTSVGNRRALDAKLTALVTAAKADNGPLVVVMVDIDHFKQINDVFGHALGDRVLVQMAKLLTEQTRGYDVVTRIGGEEFVIVLPRTAPADALDVCERLRRRIASFPWETIAPGLKVAVSAGMAAAPAYDAAALVERADAAMYSAKRAGRNRVCVAD